MFHQTQTCQNRLTGVHGREAYSPMRQNPFHDLTTYRWTRGFKFELTRLEIPDIVWTLYMCKLRQCER